MLKQDNKVKYGELASRMDRGLLVTCLLVFLCIITVYFAWQNKFVQASWILTKQHVGTIIKSANADQIPVVPLSIDVEPQQIVEQENQPLLADWQEHKVRRGQNLPYIFKKFGIPRESYKEITSKPLGKRLVKLHPGQVLKFRFEQDKLSEMEYVASETYRIHVASGTDGFSFKEHKKEYNIQTGIATGTIDSSLFHSAMQAGISNKVTMDLANLFAWDIDFSKDMRRGDKFSVVYEKLFLDGEKVKDGKIIAAEFINGGKKYRAFRYTEPKTGKTSYYSENGVNLKKAFLRSPVDFTRISSYFGKRRHPVLNRMRNHNGVDYAAPRGTPVRSTGAGKIIFQGRKGGYGKVVIIRHELGYRTLYAHLQKFRHRKGAYVSQGQTIGYVGSSGLATGPHLHYEFQFRGRHKNPLRITLPDNKPMNPNLLPNFKLATKPLMAMLDMVSGSNIAMSPTNGQFN